MLLGERCICSGGKDFPFLFSLSWFFILVFYLVQSVGNLMCLCPPREKTEEGEDVQFQRHILLENYSFCYNFVYSLLIIMECKINNLTKAVF